MISLGVTTVLFGMLFKVLPDVLSGLTPQYWQFWVGLLLVALGLASARRGRRRDVARAASAELGGEPPLVLARSPGRLGDRFGDAGQLIRCNRNPHAAILGPIGRAIFQTPRWKIDQRIVRR